MIAQAVSSLALILYIYIKVPVLRLKPSEIHINLKLLKKNSRLQLRLSPAADHAFTSDGRWSSPASTPGVDAVVAFNAASIINSYVLAPGASLASSVTTFSAQNRGGGKYDRIPRGFGITMAIAVIYTVFVTLIILFAGRPLFGIFLKPWEQNAIALGLSYIRPMACFYFMAGMIVFDIYAYRKYGRNFNQI